VFRRGWCSVVSWGCFVVVGVLAVLASPEVVVCVPLVLAGVELPPDRFWLSVFLCVVCRVLFFVLCVVGVSSPDPDSDLLLRRWQRFVPSLFFFLCFHCRLFVSFW